MNTYLGEAQCTFKGGLRYTGTMLNGEFHGKGKLIFGKKGGYYEGYYRLGRQASNHNKPKEYPLCIIEGKGKDKYSHCTCRGSELESRVP